MNQRWLGTVMVALILGGVGLVLVLNLNLEGRSRRASSAAESATSQSAAPTPAPSAPANRPAGFREYPIGDEVERKQMRIAAVWLPMVQLDGTVAGGASDMIHLEADIHATEGNKNGCPKDEFVPYLNVSYAIVPEGGSGSAEPMRGEMMPMVARDGWHYGASIPRPAPGRYRLTYTIKPPTAAGRHSDPATGVDPWWEPFDVSFEWEAGPSGE